MNLNFVKFESNDLFTWSEDSSEDFVPYYGEILVFKDASVESIKGNVFEVRFEGERGQIADLEIDYLAGTNWTSSSETC